MRKVFLLIVFLLTFSSLCFGGSIKVMPTRLFLAGSKQTAVLKVTNEGNAKVTIQVAAVKWSQGKNGSDIYEPTEDIVFFPKIFTMEKGKEWFVRLGAKDQKVSTKEAAYRIYLQEIPVSKPEGSQLTLALRLSVPVFIRPVKETKAWAIEKVELSGGLLLVKIKNNGNSHITVGKIKASGFDASGKNVFQKEVAGWYVLSGVVRTFGLKIPAKDCMNSKIIKIETKAGDSIKTTKLDVDNTLCPKESEGMIGKKKARRP